MAFETFYSYTEYLPPCHKYLIGSLRIKRGFSPEMILKVETPECWGHNFHVTVVGTGHVPQIKNSPKVSSRPDHYLLLAISPRETSKNEQQAKLPKMMDVKLTANSYRKFQLKMTNIISWNSFYSNTLPPSSKNSRFQNETKCKPLLWKWVLLKWEKKKIHINNSNNNNYYYYYNYYYY